MNGYDLYIREAEWLWLTWLASLVALLVVTARTFSRVRPVELRRFLVSEEGAAYSLAYVLTFPFYVIFICIVVQTSMLLMVRLGVAYAAFAGARSAAVWVPVVAEAENSEKNKVRDYAKDKVDLAVTAALTPFASASQADARDSFVAIASSRGNPFKTQLNAQTFIDRYRGFIGSDVAEGPVRSDYLRRKYVFASGRFVKSVTCDQLESNFTYSGQPWTQDAVVTVEYKAPFFLPIVAKFFGGKLTNESMLSQIQILASNPVKQNLWGADYYYLPMRVTARLQLEVPKSDNRRLNISDPFKHQAVK